MKKGKILSVLLISVMTVLSVTACAGGGAKETTNKDAVADSPKDDDVTIRIMTRWSDDAPFSVYYRQKIDEFNAMDNGITIVDESLSEEAAYLDKLRSSIATGNQPEIFVEYGGARIQDYVEEGILLDLQPALDADKEWADSFLDDLFDKWYYDEYPGTFGIPTQFYAVMLYYNKSILEENGFEAPPETLEEMIEMCQTLLDNGQQPMSLGEKDNWRGGHFLNNLVMKSYGAQGVIDIANRDMSYDDPRMIELYGIIKDFNDKGFFGDNAVGVDANTEDTDFLTNKVALRFQGTWFLPQITSDYDGDVENIGVAPFPYINEKFKQSYQGGAADGFSVSDRKETNEAAIEVLKYFTSKEYFAGAEAFCKGGVYVSKFESLPDAEIDIATRQTKELLAEAKEFRDDIQTYDPESHMLDTVRSAIQGLFIGNTPEQCATEIAGKMQIK